jgi:hypothetical protein
VEPGVHEIFPLTQTFAMLESAISFIQFLNEKSHEPLNEITVGKICFLLFVFHLSFLVLLIKEGCGQVSLNVW